MKKEEINIPEAQRTLVLTSEQIEAIGGVLGAFELRHVNQALEEIAQQLLNNAESLHYDLGDEYFTLRQLRDFYQTLEPIMAPLREAYQSAINKKYN